MPALYLHFTGGTKKNDSITLGPFRFVKLCLMEVYAGQKKDDMNRIAFSRSTFWRTNDKPDDTWHTVEIIDHKPA
jgi:hypothetical protein